MAQPLALRYYEQLWEEMWPQVLNQSFAATFVIEMMGAGLRYLCIHLLFSLTLLVIIVLIAIVIEIITIVILMVTTTTTTMTIEQIQERVQAVRCGRVEWLVCRCTL